MRVCVIGGGILGLATARQVMRAMPGAEVTVLEREAAVALHQTGRNSGVVHAGVYYEPGSLKARLCRRGATLMEAYCAEHGLPFERCGKVVVALDEQELPRLQELHRRALANGVPGARLIDGAELRAIEPAAAGIAALHSPTSAIADFGAVARRLAAEIVAAGGAVRCGTGVARVEHAGGRGALGEAGPEPSVRVVLADGSTVLADRVVVCAGLGADLLARASGRSAMPRIVPFRGEYFTLAPAKAAEVRGLIYPVPDPALPFLGIHLTRRVDGAVLVGPNAVLALGRGSYRWRDLDLAGTAEILRSRATWRLLRRQWRAGAGELARSASRRRYVAEARRYLPSITASDVARAPAGIRAQAVEADGALVDDFRIDADGPVAWVRNAPSPAATSSLAIAEELVTRVALA